MGWGSELIQAAKADLELCALWKWVMFGGRLREVPGGLRVVFGEQKPP